ncbi:hypothetical protein [Micromonospora sp. NPDC005203]|uniref:hypothetical protein n=1 Tax=Micromonospora sp. NPDC005203 TaxID=3364226 RepID=UPI003680F73F
MHDDRRHSPPEDAALVLAVRRTLLRQLTRVDPARFGPELAEALVTRSQQVKIRRGVMSRRTAEAIGIRCRGASRPAAGDPR